MAAVQLVASRAAPVAVRAAVAREDEKEARVTVEAMVEVARAVEERAAVRVAMKDLGNVPWPQQ